MPPRMTTRVCEQCTRTFTGLARHLLRANHGRFCSQSCASRFKLIERNRRQVGAANPCWRGGVSQHPSKYTRAYEARYPKQARASRLLRAAVRAGRIVRPTECSRCAVPCKPHGHHDNYRRPLDVLWLCRDCHRIRHIELGRPQGRRSVHPGGKSSWFKKSDLADLVTVERA